MNLITKDLEDTKNACKLLMQTPHYKNTGEAGMFAIISQSKALGVDPVLSLNGGLYFVNGRVEMSANMMNQLIRSQGHSISMSSKSTDQICILHGKRKDNGDTWVESFSIEEAKKAGIYRNQWIKYPKDMLFARALSRLARRLFPDIIKGCYVEGEISSAIEAETIEKLEEPKIVEIETIDKITIQEAEYLNHLLECDDHFKALVKNFVKNDAKVNAIIDLPRATYLRLLKRAEEHYAKVKQSKEETKAGA